MQIALANRPSYSLIFFAAAAILLSLGGRPIAGQAPAPAQVVTPAVAQAPAKPAKLTPKEAREAEITAESEKLLQLAVELKGEVDKSNKDTMSLAVIKKAAEVEKLANTLRLHLLVD